MIFVDTNVLMHAVGGAHPLKADARVFFADALERRSQLATSAEVLQELLHAYLPVGRVETLDAALGLADASIGVIWPVERDDVLLARALSDGHAGLGARDLMHLACCQRHEVNEIKTFDRALDEAFRRA